MQPDAKSTAETNAARLMAHPMVAARILKLRGRQLIRREDLESARNAARHILDLCSDERLRLAASRRIEALSKLTVYPIDDDDYADQLIIGYDQASI